MELILQDTITLWTPKGDCKIQLMYGDITKHSKEDKVDLVMVSAFPGDYGAQRRTVIGALWYNLGVNVNNLSMNKELDLRSLFNCWLSPPLTEHCPFKKLLCFERNRGASSMFEQIRDLFRVFVPVFSNKETTVITPLLATGNQGFSKTLCLSAMVEGAAGWICAGLSLRCLKIVLYESPNQEVNKLFADLKEKWIKKSENLKSKSAMSKSYKFDVYVMYDESDKKRVQTVESVLVKKKQDITVYTELPKFDENKVWQGDIYKNMILSKKIVAVLTPAFVNSKYCLELFNMAMCCGRLRKREMLLPFYFEQVDSMPFYMGLVQYFDCRIKRAGDNGDVKVENACIMIINDLDEDKDINLQAVKNDTEDVQEEQEETYDLFISYSHKNPKEAKALLDMFSEKNPDLKIFFDRNELTMGNLWQSSLYQAMSGTRCVVCLISSAYINSTVCQEEYNIALARYLSESEDILFIPMCIEEMQEVPYWFSEVKMVDARGDNFNIAAKEILKKTLQWLKNGNVPDFVCKNQKMLHLGDIYPKIREKEVNEKYTFNKTSEMLEPKTVLKFPSLNKGNNKIVISHAHDSLYCSVFLGKLLKKHIPGIDINYVSDDIHNRMHFLDTAQKIIIFLSNDFVRSAQHMEELHIALVRQRSSKGKRIVHIIQTTDLPDKPMFLNLLPCVVSLKDAFWDKFCKKYISQQGPAAQRKHIMSERPDFPGTFSCSLTDYQAFVTASYDVVEDFTVDHKKQEVRSELNQINILKLKLYLEPEETQKQYLHSMVPVNNEILVKLELSKEENWNGYAPTKETSGEGKRSGASSDSKAAKTDISEATKARLVNPETSEQRHVNEESSKTKKDKTGEGQVTTNDKNSKAKTDNAEEMKEKEDRRHGVVNDGITKTEDKTGDNQVKNSDTNSKNTKAKADIAKETKEKSNKEQDSRGDGKPEITHQVSKSSQKSSSACVVL